VRELIIERGEPFAKRGMLVRPRRTAGDMGEPIALDPDHAPSGAAEPRVDAENTNRACHDGW
jgi:hypothetical protein